MRLLILFILTIPSLAFAECYVVGDLKGYSVRESDNYVISKDGISSQKYIIEINGDNSSVTPNDLECTTAGDNALLCLDKSAGNQTTIETWSVYPSKNKVVYTKTINGYGVFNGANMFVGNIKGKCN